MDGCGLARTRRLSLFCGAALPDLLLQLLVAAALGIEESLQHVLPTGRSAWGIIPLALAP